MEHDKVEQKEGPSVDTNPPPPQNIKARSSYILFSMSVREKILAELPKHSKHTEVMKRTGELWRALKPDEKAIWEEKSREEKQQMKAYNLVIGKRPNKKDPNAPKRPMPGFLHFSQVMRQVIKGKSPSVRPEELSKMLGEQWAALSDDQKAPFLEKAALDKERWQKEMQVYKKSELKRRQQLKDEAKTAENKAAQGGNEPDDPPVTKQGDEQNVPASETRTENLEEQGHEESRPKVEDSFPNAAAEQGHPGPGAWGLGVPGSNPGAGYDAVRLLQHFQARQSEIDHSQLAAAQGLLAQQVAAASLATASAGLPATSSGADPGMSTAAGAEAPGGAEAAAAAAAAAAGGWGPHLAAMAAMPPAMGGGAPYGQYGPYHAWMASAMAQQLAAAQQQQMAALAAYGMPLPGASGAGAGAGTGGGAAAAAMAALQQAMVTGGAFGGGGPGGGGGQGGGGGGDVKAEGGGLSQVKVEGAAPPAGAGALAGLYGGFPAGGFPQHRW